MPGLAIQISFKNVDAVKARLNAVGDGMLHLGPAWEAVGKGLQEYYSGVAFSSQGEVFGKKWPPLNEQYATYKANLGHDTKTRSIPLIKGQMLVWSGKMKDSFGYEVVDKGVIVGNKAPYFKYHQSAEPRHKLPRRVMIGVNEPVRLLIKKIIEEALDAQIQGTAVL